MLQGTVKWYDVDKGWGYITRDDGGDVGVGRGSILFQPPELKAGQRVQFSIVEGRTGASAINVGEIGSAPPSRTVETPPPGKYQGTVKWFDTDKGWGYITRDDGGDVGVARASIQLRPPELKAGQRVRFDTVDGRTGTSAINVSLVSSTPVEAGPAPDQAQTTVNWMAEPLSAQGHGDHFYTTSTAERASAATVNGYRAEGVACYVFDGKQAATTPLYRLFNAVSGDHFYTTSSAERDSAVSAHGYRTHGVVCYVFAGQQAGTRPLYRLFSGSTSDHFYTMSEAERDNAVGVHGYRSEGVACYVFESREAGSTALYRLFRP